MNTTADIKKYREQQENTDSKKLHNILQGKIDAITSVLPETITISREEFEQELWKCWEASKHHHQLSGFPNFIGWLQERNQQEATANTLSVQSI